VIRVPESRSKSAIASSSRSSRPRRGRGLGLPIARRTAELDRGSLTLACPDGEASHGPCPSGLPLPRNSPRTDAAFRQPREQILRPSCEADVAGACDRAPRCTLAVLRGVPEFVAHYPERRNLLGDPLCFRIQPRDAFASVRILDVEQSIPDQATDVQLVVQNAGSAFRVFP